MSETAIATVAPKDSAFSIEAFDHAQRVAKMLASSSLIPQGYQGRVDNCLIALEMSHRIGASPLMVMQNLHIIQGKPSWSSPFIIASINTKIGKLKWRKSGEGEAYGYEAYVTTTDGELVSPKVDWAMVKKEGWLDKPGSKWKTMPELMFQYRSAAFFGRLHCPEILMGMQTLEEVIDVHHQTVETVPVDKEKERLLELIKDAKTVDDLTRIEEHVTPDVWETFATKMTELKTDPAQTKMFP
jgi:hypothetical protein